MMSILRDMPQDVHASRWPLAVNALALMAFVGIAVAFIPHLGVQHDEALFAPALHPGRCGSAQYSLHIGQAEIPLMLMNYVGALKAGLQWLVTCIFAPSVWTLRLPTVLLAAVSIWLAKELSRILGGTWAGVICCALVATDATYLLTATFDWGPVVLQHVLLLGSILCLIHWVRTARTVLWAAACFLIGLAFWDKAVAIWPVFGLLAGTLLHSETRNQLCQAVARLRFSGLVSGAAAFCVGAAPLIIFNLARNAETVTMNQRLDTDIAWKTIVLRDSLEGAWLPNYLFGGPVTPEWPVGYGLFDPTRSLQGWLLAGVLLVSISAGRANGRIVRFILVSFAAAWTAMVLSGGGGSVHHTVLLWPAPQILIAVAISGWGKERPPWGALVAVALVIICNVALLTNCYRQASSLGGGKGWSNAILKLPPTLGRFNADKIYALDWGIVHGACYFGTPIEHLSADFSNEAIGAILNRPDVILVQPLPPHVFDDRIHHSVEHVAKALKIRLKPVDTVRDSKGSEAFLILRPTPDAPR